MYVIDKLRAEMHASTTDVLKETMAGESTLAQIRRFDGHGRRPFATRLHCTIVFLCPMPLGFLLRHRHCVVRIGV
jgi:hypothetical protein